MPLRPGRCYSKLDTMPYTRKEYIKGVPPPKLTRYDFGNPSGNFQCIVQLYALEDGLVRSNALDAARMIANKEMESIGQQNYHLKVNKYPHHVLRENKMLAMAGADRLQEGMRLSFGKPIGTAAIVNKGDVILYIRCDPSAIELAKKALKKAASKISVKTRIRVISNSS